MVQSLEEEEEEEGTGRGVTTRVSKRARHDVAGSGEPSRQNGPCGPGVPTGTCLESAESRRPVACGLRVHWPVRVAGLGCTLAGFPAQTAHPEPAGDLGRAVTLPDLETNLPLSDMGDNTSSVTIAAKLSLALSLYQAVCEGLNMISSNPEVCLKVSTFVSHFKGKGTRGP